MKVGSIDVSKIDKAHLYQGNKGKYLSIALHENKDGPDRFGNDGFITQSVSKEAREKGVKGPIIGNWKRLGGSSQPKPLKKAPEKVKPDTDDSDSIPF